MARRRGALAGLKKRLTDSSLSLRHWFNDASVSPYLTLRYDVGQIIPHESISESYVVRTKVDLSVSLTDSTSFALRYLFASPCLVLQ